MSQACVILAEVYTNILIKKRIDSLEGNPLTRLINDQQNQDNLEQKEIFFSK